jgi:cytochrome c oxidase assembly protein subunit 15
MREPTLPAPEQRALARRLAIGFAVLAGLTYALIVRGALVRANHAGLACPDWPLCFGQVIPEFNMRIAFEWGHRVMAGSIALVFATLAALTLRDAALRAHLRRLLALTAALLALQIVLGGLTVLQLLAAWTVTAHLIVGNSFALGLAFCAARLFDLSANEVPEPRPVTPSMRWLVTCCAGMLMLQMVLGGLVSSSYAGLLCDEWPTCEGGVWVPSLQGGQGLHLLHRFNAYGLTFALFGLFLASRIDPAEIGSPLRRRVAITFALVLAQIFVGVADVLMRLAPEITGLHSGLAALLCLAVALSMREVWSRPALELGDSLHHPSPRDIPS